MTKLQETRASLSVVVWYYMTLLTQSDKIHNAPAVFVTSISTKYDTI